MRALAGYDAGMIPLARRPVHLLVLALGLFGRPAAAQEVRGVGDQPSPISETIQPGSVMAIGGEPVPAEDFAAWLIEELSAPHLRDFAVGWELGRIAQERGLAADEEQVRAELEEEIAIRVQGAFRG